MRLRLLAYFIVLAFGLRSLSTQAQPLADELWLTKPVESGGMENQQAVRFLWATNQIGAQARVHYQAGQSVELLPGFDTRRAAQFEAQIRPIRFLADNSLAVVVFPNPILQQATITCQLQTVNTIEWALLGVNGHVFRRERSQIVQEPGVHQWTLEGTNLPTGVYLLEMKTGTITRTVRLVKE
ncbi:T9SS type A sorting domain-containing protein [Spirosoma aerophilum]